MKRTKEEQNFLFKCKEYDITNNYVQCISVQNQLPEKIKKKKSGIKSPVNMISEHINTALKQKALHSVKTVDKMKMWLFLFLVCIH